MLELVWLSVSYRICFKCASAASACFELGPQPAAACQSDGGRQDYFQCVFEGSTAQHSTGRLLRSPFEANNTHPYPTLSSQLCNI